MYRHRNIDHLVAEYLKFHL